MEEELQEQMPIKNIATYKIKMLALEEKIICGFHTKLTNVWGNGHAKFFDIIIIWYAHIETSQYAL